MLPQCPAHPEPVTLDRVDTRRGQRRLTRRHVDAIGDIGARNELGGAGVRLDAERVEQNGGRRRFADRYNDVGQIGQVVHTRQFRPGPVADGGVPEHLVRQVDQHLLEGGPASACPFGELPNLGGGQPVVVAPGVRRPEIAVLREPGGAQNQDGAMPRRQRRVVAHVGQQRHEPVGQRRHPYQRAQGVTRVATGCVLVHQRPLLGGPRRLRHRWHPGRGQPLDEDRTARGIHDRGRRLQTQQHTVVLIGQDIQIPVGALAHVADTLLELGQQRFAANLLAPAVEHDALDVPGARHTAFHHRADEQVPLPGGEVRAGVERQP